MEYKYTPKWETGDQYGPKELHVDLDTMFLGPLGRFTFGYSEVLKQGLICYDSSTELGRAMIVSKGGPVPIGFELVASAQYPYGDRNEHWGTIHLWVDPLLRDWGLKHPEA